MKVSKVDIMLPNASELFERSLRETGFAVLTNHRIDPELISSTMAEWAQFFSSPTKYEYLFNPETQDGYFPMRSENAKNSEFKDLKEFYHLFPFSQTPNGMTYSTVKLNRMLNDLGKCLLSCIQKHMPDDLKAKLSMPLPQMIHNSEGTLFRALHYPPLPGDVRPGEVRAAAHEDINLITVLPAATAPGLQVRDLEGNWHDVSCNPGDIVVNAGDMLSLATSNYYKSTPHRVVTPKGMESKSRYSMPLFIHPRGDVQLTPEKTAHQFLMERLEQLGLVKRKDPK